MKAFFIVKKGKIVDTSLKIIFWDAFLNSVRLKIIHFVKKQRKKHLFVQRKYYISLHKF